MTPLGFHTLFDSWLWPWESSTRIDQALATFPPFESEDIVHEFLKVEETSFPLLVLSGGEIDAYQVKKSDTPLGRNFLFCSQLPIWHNLELLKLHRTIPCTDFIITKVIEQSYLWHRLQKSISKTHRVLGIPTTNPFLLSVFLFCCCSLVNISEFQYGFFYAHFYSVLKTEAIVSQFPSR